MSVQYGGSLKAEHGTGRAIASFVELEWGTTAYRVMHRIKALFDPEGLLNPGVLLNADPQVHMHDLKRMPLADEIVDMCIECGFCEPACPSHHMTMSPRQRIVVTREKARLKRSGEDPARLAKMEELFEYAGLATCAWSCFPSSGPPPPPRCPPPGLCPLPSPPPPRRRRQFPIEGFGTGHVGRLDTRLGSMILQSRITFETDYHDWSQTSSTYLPYMRGYPRPRDPRWD
ncbi:MAG: hypothetical protein NVV83_21445 [Afipia sp.]|nr:hypothetical protein [Afipia sp.]